MLTTPALFVFAVCAAYLLYLLALVRHRKLNLLDLFFNIVICVVPPLYIAFYFPFAGLLGRIGIQTPSLVFFGTLLVMIFLYLSRVVILLHQAEKKQTRLIEELALLKMKLDPGRKRVRTGRRG